MNVVKQPNSWECYACVAAMITGETLEDVIECVGHDGSEKAKWSLHPQKHRGFTKAEINFYLATRCYTLGAVGANIAGFKWTPRTIKDYDRFELKIPMDIPAMVLVKSKLLGKNGYHCLFWDGKKAFDPYKDEPVKLEDYELDEWWPVVKLNDHGEIKKFKLAAEES